MLKPPKFSYLEQPYTEPHIEGSYSGSTHFIQYHENNISALMVITKMQRAEHITQMMNAIRLTGIEPQYTQIGLYLITLRSTTTEPKQGIPSLLEAALNWHLSTQKQYPQT